MKFIVTLGVAVSLSGCITLPQGSFDNRVVCTVARDEAYVVSKYSGVGISNKIADVDREVICAKVEPVVIVPVPEIPASAPKEVKTKLKPK